MSDLIEKVAGNRVRCDVESGRLRGRVATDRLVLQFKARGFSMTRGAQEPPTRLTVVVIGLMVVLLNSPHHHIDHNEIVAAA